MSIPGQIDRRRVGLICPNCQSQRFLVVYTRAAVGGRIVRRRECCRCGRRITTWEQRVTRREQSAGGLRQMTAEGGRCIGGCLPPSQSFPPAMSTGVTIFGIPLGTAVATRAFPEE